MSWCKAKAEYVLPDPNLAPGPKHGHWSYRAPDPALEAAELAAENALNQAWGFGRDISVDDFKKNIESLPFAVPEGWPEPGRDVDISYMKAPVRDGTALELKVYRSKSSRENATLIFRMHGGGWVVGCHETEEPENRLLGSLPNVVVVSVHYRMAPEFPFPTAPEDCFDVLQWCKLNAEGLGIDPEKLILAGCSAGANLAAVVSIMARDAGLSGIIGQHLAIPVTCHPKLFSHVPDRDSFELLSWVQNHDAALVDARRMEVFWDLYLGLDLAPDPRHSPLLCKQLKGLPPTLLQIAGRDPLRDEGIAYGEALQAAGVSTEIIVHSGLPHGFSGFIHTREANNYYERLVEFVKKCALG
ncbi:hypothetical protein AJ80_00164 [Polytolypa hystricis UAMH7299]|uniref:Alpha/beta hydrolase fold-3 domain-containing protein n=1 Tax=Polytolypa hystricis (strain UAMH7299) TaxID=1447883 RepID=A0A2B7Z4W6_POLH7|nr:hypothetical protein AJ80_00164 [Polytolypa hystricis UAMH7299]